MRLNLIPAACGALALALAALAPSLASAQRLFEAFGPLPATEHVVIASLFDFIETIAFSSQ